MDSAGKPNESEASSSSGLCKRVRYSTRKEEQQYTLESSAESGKDFSAGSDDEYVLPKKPLSSSPSPSPSPPPLIKGKKTRKLRGINAYRAAVQARDTVWNVQPMETGPPNVLISDRGRSRGRVRGRARGFSRGRINRRGIRDEMLAEHRQLVESLQEEEEVAHGSQQASHAPVPKLPPLSDGNFNRFIYHFYV